MTAKYGRFGQDVTVKSPSSWEQDGNTISVEGWCTPSSAALYKVAREQFAGLVTSPWERIVPCSFSDDSSKDGYYRIVEGSTTIKPGTGVHNAFPYSLRLERLKDWQEPKIQVVTFGANRSNKDAGVTADPWSAVPSDAGGSYGINGTPAAKVDRSGPGLGGTWAGTTVHWRTDSVYTDEAATYRVAHSDFYDMAATLTVDGYTVLGDRWQFSGNHNDWVLSNGYVKLAGNGSYFCGFYGPNSSTTTSWSAATPMKIGFYASAAFYSMYEGSSDIDITGMRVDYNGPELVALTFSGSYMPGSAVTIPVEVTVVLRRGSAYAEFYCSANTTRAWAVAFNSTTACTSITDCLHATSNNADGNRVALIFGGSTTDDTTEGEMHLASAALTGQFGIGLEFAGSSSAGNSTVANVRDQYFSALSETQVVLGE